MTFEFSGHVFHQKRSPAELPEKTYMFHLPLRFPDLNRGLYYPVLYGLISKAMKFMIPEPERISLSWFMTLLCVVHVSSVWKLQNTLQVQAEH